ncbi:MAG: ATP-binding cassette domain-containing protein [Acidimicrobiaceae bacterium]|nr:ATP-binding cassette domain-containing protein [Acidimicrobiaceae bacterium]MYE96602.1 ATP-binding cassette domain-containing protein [Acidimicrobiaceae bacterium]MYI52565.1 ATP-binding cassette domain-containing protein [Acidimicrobiaceae bacterium]
MSTTASTASLDGALGSLAAGRGEPVRSAANLPVRLDDAGSAWYVARGAVDVFSLEYAGGRPAAAPRQLTRVGPGGLIFGLVDEAGQLRMEAKGLDGARLHRIGRRDLTDAMSGDAAGELAAAVDAWVQALSEAVGAMVEFRPAATLLADPARGGHEEDLAAGTVLAARSGVVAWVRAVAARSPRTPDRSTGAEPDTDRYPMAYLGTESLGDSTLGWMALAADGWATLDAGARLVAVDSDELARRGLLIAALAEFHEVLLRAERLNRLLLLADEVNEQSARSVHRRMSRERAAAALASLGPPPGAASRAAAEQRADTSHALEAALEIVGRHEGVHVSPARRLDTAAERTVPDLARASGVRFRQVRLDPADRWWRSDSGALVAFAGEDAQPVALVPTLWRGYRMHPPPGGKALKVTAERAQRLAPHAWQLYPGLPHDRPARIRDVLRVAAERAGADAARFAATGVGLGLLSQVPALALGALAGWVLPFGARDVAMHLIIAMALFSAVSLVLGVFSGAMLMRLQGRSSARVSAAAWARLLSLPSSFFRSTVAGELAQRMASLQTLRDQLSAVVIRASMSLIFVLPTLGILLLYDVRLAVISLGVGIVSVGAVVVLGLWQLRPQRELHDASRRLGGQLLQIIGGVAKVRSSGAEAAVFACWADAYRDAGVAGISVSRLNEHLVALSSSLPALAGAVLIAAALGSGDTDVGTFLVVYAASMTVLAAVTEFGSAIGSLTAVLPSYEQAKPILNEVPEQGPAGAGGAEQATLRGEVRIDRASFRYDDDGPLVLDDVSLHASPGEFVAIVGASGSGKSTLLRLILGLEAPSSGTVSFDGRDLRSLDRQHVRRQIGTVPQDSGLQPGSLLENIVGVVGEPALDDAWRAARLAGLDADIEAMPMQMLTPVSDQATTFSGGQVQRVRIAAALARNPRIVVFDEATSWLDAESQSIVMRGVETLAATRIVVAHRLSTIRMADRVYMLDHGRVVQQGTVDELSSVEGPFQELVRRQQV